MSYPVFLICRDRLTSLRGLLSWLESVRQAGEVYLMDNASTWPPLLDFFESTRHCVLRATENLGHTVGWETGWLAKYARGRRFILSDPDLLPAPDCPPDAIDRMADVLNRKPEALKAGFSLATDDLPDSPIARKARARESRWWQTWDAEAGAWCASIDTTFALHSPRSAEKHRRKPAYRLPVPYVARHLPWYVDPARMTAEEAYYRAHARQEITHWARSS